MYVPMVSMLKLSLWLVVVGALAMCGANSSFSGLEESNPQPEDYIMERYSHIIGSSREEVPSAYKNSAPLEDGSGEKIYETGGILDIHRVARSPSVISEFLPIPQNIPVPVNILKTIPNENIPEKRSGLTGRALLIENANVVGFGKLVGQSLSTTNGQLSKLGNQAGEAGGLLVNAKADAATSLSGVVGTANQQLDNVNTEVGKTGGLLIRGKANIAGSLTGAANRQFNHFGQQVGQAGSLLFKAMADAASSIGDVTGVVSSQVDDFGGQMGMAGGLLVMAKANAAGTLGGVVDMVTKEVDHFKTQVGQTGGVLIKGKVTVASSLGNLSTKPITGSLVLPSKQ